VIFVTVGTNEASFDRLLRSIQSADGEELVVQHGPSAVRPPGARCVESLPFDEVTRTMSEARVVVTHAGVGSVMTALLCGKRPIVVPRLRRHREAVDDHQLPFGRRLEQAGLVTLVSDERALQAAIAAAGSSAPLRLKPDRRLVSELRGYLQTRIDQGDRSARGESVPESSAFS
jgi:exopolysaccharide biosynthesis glucuronosyltransferase PssE